MLLVLEAPVESLGMGQQDVSVRLDHLLDEEPFDLQFISRVRHVPEETLGGNGIFKQSQIVDPRVETCRRQSLGLFEFGIVEGLGFSHIGILWL